MGRARRGRGIPALIPALIIGILVGLQAGMGMGMESRPRRELSGTVAARRRPENDRARTCNVRDYGAVGDGVTKDTAAIQRTIAACSNDSVILLPAPYQFLTAPFNLTSHTTLRIETGAALLASDDLDDWFVIAPLPSYPNGREARNPQRYVSFIGGSDIVDVAIDGGGLLDGQGEQWYLRHWNDVLEYDRGRLIEPMFCQDFRVTDLYILNPPFWAIHPYACDSVLVENVDVRAPIASPNTDGIDPDSTTNVVIRNCTINNSDDNIAIKSGYNEGGRTFGRPSANILVEDCIFGYGDGVAIGSETSGGVFNVTIRNSVFTGLSLRTLRVKTARGRGNVVSNITFSDIQLIGLHGMALTVDMLFESGGTPGGPPDQDPGTPIVRDVTYQRVSGTSVAPGRFRCQIESPCTNVQLIDIDITTRLPFVCENAYGSSTRVSPAPCLLSNGTDASATYDRFVDEQLEALERRIADVKRAARLAEFGF